MAKKSKKNPSKEFNIGGMDALYGVEKDVNEMATTNAKDRVKKYPNGGDIDEGWEMAIPPTPSGGAPAPMEDFPEEDWEGHSAADSYNKELYGGGTSYDAKTVADWDDTYSQTMEDKHFRQQRFLQPNEPTWDFDLPVGELIEDDFEKGGEVKAKYPNGGQVGDSTMTDATGDPNIHNPSWQAPFLGIHGSQGGLDTDSGQAGYGIHQDPNAPDYQESNQSLPSLGPASDVQQASTIGGAGDQGKLDDDDKDEFALGGQLPTNQPPTITSGQGPGGFHEDWLNSQLKSNMANQPSLSDTQVAQTISGVGTSLGLDDDENTDSYFGGGVVDARNRTSSTKGYK